jgi:hypothetical protein
MTPLTGPALAGLTRSGTASNWYSMILWNFVSPAHKIPQDHGTGQPLCLASRR